MEDVLLSLDNNGNGKFYMLPAEEKWGEMVVRISGNHLTVYHTEVSPKAGGQGLAKKLLAE